MNSNVKKRKRSLCLSPADSWQIGGNLAVHCKKKAEDIVVEYKEGYQLGCPTW